MSDYVGVPKHINGSVGTTATRFRLTGVTVRLCVRNTHATQSLLLSFTGDMTNDIRTILAGEVFDERIAADHVWLEGSGASTTFQIVATI